MSVCVVACSLFEGKVTIEERVGELAGPVLLELGLELVDVVYASEGGRRILRLLIDKPGGVNVDDCTGVSRELGPLLDVEDVVPGGYTLEVSSPGLDRPLKSQKDFLAAVGKKIRLRTKEAIEGRKNFKATVQEVSEKDVTVEDSDGRLWVVAFLQIDRARLDVEF